MCRMVRCAAREPPRQCYRDFASGDHRSRPGCSRRDRAASRLWTRLKCTYRRAFGRYGRLNLATKNCLTREAPYKVQWGPNWEEILGGEFAKRSQDSNFEGVQKEIYGQFENTFMMYLPRLCEHCLNPACVAACPSG